MNNKRWGALGLVALVILALGCGGERPNDNKGRPIPKRSIECRDGTKVKDTGPSACHNHWGRPEEPR